MINLSWITPYVLFIWVLVVIVGFLALVLGYDRLKQIINMV